MSPAALLLITLSLAGVGVPPAQPLQPAAQQRGEPETPDAQRRSTIEEIEQLKQRFPNVEPAKLADFLDARIMEGFLLVELRQEPEQWPFVVPLKDEPNAAARITISRKPREVPDSDSPPTKRFTLILDRVGEPESAVVLTKVHLFAGPLYGQLNMSMDRMWTDGRSVTVQMIQLLAGFENQPGITLHVSRSAPGDAEDTHVSIPADTFVELSRREPEVFEEYVRPMLEELGIGGVLESTVRDLALQAFLRDLPVDDATAAKVELLLAQLDAADFAEREAAQAQLQGLGRPAATVLAKLMAQRELSPEQVTRVRSLMLKYERAPQELIEARLKDAEFLRSVAALRGEPEDEHLAGLARQRIEALGAEPATRPAGS